MRTLSECRQCRNLVPPFCSKISVPRQWLCVYPRDGITGIVIRVFARICGAERFFADFYSCWSKHRRLTHLFHSSLWTFPRYAFIEFRTSAEAEAAAKEVTGKLVVGKAIRAVVCSERPSRTVANWKQPTERELDDFDLTTLYVSCLPRLTERTTLAQIFRTADKIKYESLPDGTSKG